MTSDATFQLRGLHRQVTGKRRIMIANFIVIALPLRPDQKLETLPNDALQF